MKDYTVLARDINTKEVRKVKEIKCKSLSVARRIAMTECWSTMGNSEQMIVASPEQMKKQWDDALK